MSDISLAEKYYEEGKYLEAIKIYDILLNGNPRNIQFLQAKAKCSMSLSLWHDCFASILKASKSENWHSSFLDIFVDNLTEKLSAKVGLVEEKQTNDFEENLLCKCCCQVFCRPITLSCGNTYCRNCVLKDNKCVYCSSPDCIVGELDELSVNIVLTDIIQNCFQSKLKALELRCDGNECFSNRKYDAALQKYTEALQLDPTNHFILGNLSNVYAVLEEYQTALDYAERASKLIPNWEKGFYRKACALVGLKKYSQAALCYLKVLLIDPHNDVTRNSLKKVLVEILTNSESKSRCASMIDDLATSLDSLIESQEDTKQNHLCVENVQSVLSEKLRETDLECSLCCRMFYDPVTCPCGHTFCQWCLNRCLDHKPVCPVCRYLIKEYINTTNQNVTGSIQAICKKYFPEQFEERKRQHEEKITKLASVASDTDEDIPVFVCVLPIPTVPYHFNIFEPRYRLMIRECMESGSRQFAMCSPGESNSFSNYGVMLEVEEFTLLPDGTSLVKVVGGRRFKVLSRGKENGYNTAKVEWLKDESFQEKETDIIYNRQQSIYAKIVDWYSSLSLFTKIRLSTGMELPLSPPQCDFENINQRNGPDWIWWSLHILPMQPSLKHEIISMTDVRQRLDQIEQFFWENT